MESLTHTRGGLHVLLPTLGSAGDVFPVMELGIALQQRGHHATIVTNEFFADPIRGSGLGFIGLGTRQEAEAALADPRLWHPTKGFECIVERVVAPNISRLYEIVRERRAPDTVVGASALCLGARIAQVETTLRILRRLAAPAGPGLGRQQPWFRLRRHDGRPAVALLALATLEEGCGV